MPYKDIQKRLEERFSTPLSDFYDRRIIFWKDEDREFESVFDELELDGVSKIKLDGSNAFEVKKLLSADDLTGNYLVYSPISYEHPEDNWLLNIELYSEEFRSDLTSLRMSSLGIDDTPVLRKTVKLYSKFFDSKARGAKLVKMQNTYTAPTQLHLDIMAVLAGAESGSISQILQKLLTDDLDASSNTVIENISSFGSLPAFKQVINRFTGYPENQELDLEELAAFILISALAQNFDESLLRGLESYISGTKNANCYSFVHEWMLSKDRKSYFDLARDVEARLRLASRFEKADVDALLSSDIFPGIDEAVLSRYFSEIGENVIKVEDILLAVESKRTQAWFAEFEDFYDCLYYAAKMQEFYLKYNSGFHFTKPQEVWKFYEDEAYLMDTCYRKFQLSFQNALSQNNEVLEENLRQAAETVEKLYHNWFLAGLMEKWTELAESDFASLGYVSNIDRQKDFYSNMVNLENKKGPSRRSVVIISDALRYEVAAQLRDELVTQTNGAAELTARQSVFPSITKFGMASLLNVWNPSIEISNGTPEVLLDEFSTKSTKDREKRLQTINPKSAAIQAEDYKAMKMKERREYLKGKEVIYICHNKIDAIGDKAPTEKDVFKACEQAVEELRSLVKTLINDNVSEVLITADHGFLYTYEPLQEMNKISSKVLDSEAYEVGRRYILAPEGTQADYLLPVNISHEFGGTPMVGFTPRDTSRIKISGGGANFVHGGISLQEMMVPVIQFKSKYKSKNKDFTERELAKIQLLSENHKISNLGFSLDFYQPVPVGEKILPAVYRIFMMDEDGNTVSDIKEVIVDKDSPNNIDRKYHVSFNLKPGQYDRKKDYKLVISNGTDIPVEENFTIDIALADDFGFDF